MKICKAIALLGFASALFGCSSGSKAPDVKLHPLGKTGSIMLSSLKGKPVLLDFWATWCGPCRETMPHLQGIYGEFKDAGLQVVAISQESPPEVEAFIKKNSYSYPFYLDLDGSANRVFGVTSIPMSFVIDRKGNVIWSGHPGDSAKLRKAIQEAVGS